MIKKIVYLFTFLFIQNIFGQGINASETTKVSIITVGIADEAHTFYGHTALRMSKNFD